MYSRNRSCFRHWPFVLPVLSLLLLGGCAEESLDEAVDVARPVKTVVVPAPAEGGERKFPARIEAAQKAELSFRVPGKVQQLDVKQGDQVSAGQVLAKLDATDFEITVADRQAVFDKARKDYLRGKGLVDDGHISRTDFDRMESEFKSAGAALRQAKQDLAYTELRAPFDGRLAKRHIERFEEVQAKQPVFSVRGTKTLEFIIDVPEDLIKPIDLDADVPVYAAFGAGLEERFPLNFKEVATRADPDTQTFETRFTMPAPEGLTLLPGMTATVIADMRQFVDDDQAFFLPATAIAADSALAPFVWVVDQEAGTVRKQPVKLGRLLGTEIAVTGDITPGQHVVTAGTGYLQEGMRVRTVAQSEQAKPRADDVQLMLDPKSPLAKPARNTAASGDTPGADQ